MEEKILKKYNELKGRYSLPDIGKISSFFEIYKIDEDDFLLMEIRKKIVEKLIRVSEVLESFIHPDTNISDIYECKAFSNEDRDEIFRLYKKLKLAEKKAMELSFDSDEEKESDFIKETLLLWDEIKEKMIFFIDKLKEFWKSESPEKTKEGYFG